MTSTQPWREVDYLLIGGGLASATAAEEIRKRDANSSIVIATQEPQLPYHRPPLSKEYLRGEINAAGTYGGGGIYVQLPAWYTEQRVEVLQGAQAALLDPVAKTVRLADGRILRYGRLLIATGARARQLDLLGANLLGVHVLRTVADSGAIRDALAQKGQRVVVLGSGFIGMEASAQALFRGAHVSIVDPVQRVWASLVPPTLSAYFQRQFERRAAALYYGYAPTEIRAGDDGRVDAVRVHSTLDASLAPLDLACDLVLIGVGVQLNTELAALAGLAIDPRHGIIADDHLRTSAPDIYVAGDVAAYPDPVVGQMHFEHWDNAIATGQTAAANMTGGDEVYQHVPYFFSDQFDLSINMLGYPASTDVTAVRGGMESDQFTTLFVREGIMRAAFMVNDDAQMDLLRDLIAAQAAVPEPARLADPTFDLATLRPGTSGA